MKTYFLPFAAILLCPFVFFAEAEEKKQADLLRAKASGGDPESAFKLGNEYFYGENGRKKNELLAAHWYLQAAKKNIPEAMYNYAVCAERIAKSASDRFKAFQWYKKASEKDFDPARFRLASFYSNGLTDENGKVLVRKSPASALEQLEILNSREYEPGELQLALLLLQKDVLPARKARAFRILSKVCARPKSSPIAQRLLADCYYGGFGCEKNPAKAFILLRNASDRGDIEATAKLGYLHEHGANGVKKNLKQAYSFYKKAALQNHPMGLYKYGEALFEGYLKEKGKSRKDALSLLEKSASLHCVQAMYKLGNIYEMGLGGEAVNVHIAARCYYEAAKANFAPAQYKSGQFFSEGKGVRAKDDAAAFYWYERSARQGYPPAMRSAGIALIDGKGTEANRRKGFLLLQMAAKRGDVTAIRLLETMQ